MLGYKYTSGESYAYTYSWTGKTNVMDKNMLACCHIGAQFVGFEGEGEFGFGGGYTYDVYSYPYPKVLVVAEGE